MDRTVLFITLEISETIHSLLITCCILICLDKMTELLLLMRSLLYHFIISECKFHGLLTLVLIFFFFLILSNKPAVSLLFLNSRYMKTIINVPCRLLVLCEYQVETIIFLH